MILNYTLPYILMIIVVTMIAFLGIISKEGKKLFANDAFQILPGLVKKFTSNFKKFAASSDF